MLSGAHGLFVKGGGRGGERGGRRSGGRRGGRRCGRQGGKRGVTLVALVVARLAIQLPIGQPLVFELPIGRPAAIAAQTPFPDDGILADTFSDTPLLTPPPESVLSTTSSLSLIDRPHPSDPAYSTQQNELEEWYQTLRQQGSVITPVIYRYRLSRAETVIQLAAAFSLPYATLATLNHLYDNTPLPIGTEILIPSAPGLYIHLQPQHDFEELLYILRIDADTEAEATSSAATSSATTAGAAVASQTSSVAGATTGAGATQTASQTAGAEADDRGMKLHVLFRQNEYRYRFIPDAQFSPTERSAFFNRLFHVPVRNGRVTSLFGPRIDPITDIAQFHNGIDIAAPFSTPIRAAQKGRVIEIGRGDFIYGNFITIEHEGDFTTTYAHLRAIIVERGDRVTISSEIGTVGNTGHSTGPHIHFEIALKGIALDPFNYMYIPRSYLIDGAEDFRRIEDAGQ